MRICTECQEVMTKGFLIENGEAHICSNECLDAYYTRQQQEDLMIEWCQWEISDYLDLPEKELLKALKRTFKHHRPEFIATQPFHSLMTWISLYCETF